MSYDPISVTGNCILRLGIVSTGSMSIGSAAFTDLDGHMQFTNADVGAPMLVIGAVSGGGMLKTSVVSVTDSTHCTLADVATLVPDASANATLFRKRGEPIVGGLNLQRSLTAHDTMSVSFIDALPKPESRQPVLLTVLGTNEFGGTIDQVRGYIIPGSPLVKWDCDCISWDKWIYRRTTGEPTAAPSGSPATSNPVNGVFTGMTVKQIAQYIMTNALGSDGLDLDPASVDGPVIPEFTVSYAQCGDAYDQLIKAGSDGTTILHWYTDPLKTVHIEDQASISAPWDVSDTQSPQSLQSGVACTWDRSEYTNRVFVRLGAFITDAAPTTFNGDSSTRTFQLARPAATAPTITLNAASQTVGILGVDTGKDWYWNKGSQTITQDPSGTILTPSDVLVVTVAEFDTAIVLSTNQPAVDESSAIESGTGFYERVEQTSVPSTTTDGQTLAAAIAAQYGIIPKRLEASTYRPGLRIGMKQHVTIAAFDIDSDFVIDSVSLTCDENVLLWNYTAVGSPLINWDYRATLATLRPGGGDVLGSAGSPQIPWNAVAVLPGVQVVATDVTANHRRTTINLDGSQVQLTHAYVTAKVAPGVSSFIADWLVSSDNGAHWLSIFIAGNANKIVLPSGQRVATITPDNWAINPLLDGYLSRVDILQADGTVSGVEIELYGGIS